MRVCACVCVCVCSVSAMRACHCIHVCMCMWWAHADPDDSMPFDLCTPCALQLLHVRTYVRAQVCVACDNVMCDTCRCDDVMCDMCSM